MENLCYATEAKEKEIKIENIPVVCKFLNVFPKELPSLPRQREIDFEIELITGAQPISKVVYMMVSIEVKELKTQLDKLLLKGFTGNYVTMASPDFVCKEKGRNFKAEYRL